MRSLTPDPSPVARERGTGWNDGGVAKPSSAIREAAKDLRKRATLSERMPWKALRDRRLGGRKFRRQHPVGQFVVDFCCLEEMVAVEIDGSAHDDRQEHDAERQGILESMGLRFVRVTAQDVERNSLALILIEQS
jgi:adenine-specific DNA-methyltransferase